MRARACEKRESKRVRRSRKRQSIQSKRRTPKKQDGNRLAKSEKETGVGKFQRSLRVDWFEMHPGCGAAKGRNNVRTH